MRIHHGAGYRIYFAKRGVEVVVLLAGGTKATQTKDFKEALKLARTLQESIMKKSALKKWDVVEHLKTGEDMALYLEACLEDGDPALVTAALGDIARARGMSQVARDAGLSRESLYKSLSGEGNPEFATVMKVIKALGIELHASAVSVP